MNLRNNIEAHILLQNNKPIDDFLGLSSTEMGYLLYDTFGSNSPVQLKDNIDNLTLDKIPLFKLSEEYLKILQRDKQIKLTKTDALPRKILVELYDKRIVLAENIEYGISKLSREIDWVALENTRITLEIAKLVKKEKGKLFLTKKATKLLETNNRFELFKLFFQTFTEKFAWSFNDGFTEHPVGQVGWAFSIILLNKFGNNPNTSNFYAQKFLTAFPVNVSFFQPFYGTKEDMFKHCYGTRTFEKFFLWFGFVTYKSETKYLRLKDTVFKQTDIVEKIFNIDEL